MRALVPVLAAVVLLAAAPAQAGACCLSSSAFGLGRLALWEKFAINLGTTVSPVTGRWDEKTGWIGNAPGYSEVEYRAQVSAIVALHRRLQASARLPWVITQKASDPLHEVGQGLGDSALGLRYEPVYQGEYEFLPEMALNFGLTVPTGRSVGAARTVLLSDVTGRGAWVPSASLTVELARNFWFVQAAGGVTLPLPSPAADVGHTEQFGLGVQATLAGGAEVRKGLVLSAVARFGSEGATRYDGEEVPRSAQFDVGAGPAVAWVINTHWTLQGGADFGFFGSGFGRNRQGRWTGNLGLRYAYF